MARYLVPCSWEMHGTLEIDALDIGDAIAQALDYSRGGRGLPEAYLNEDSFTIDHDDIECVGDINDG